jgi:hypothetical protein
MKFVATRDQTRRALEKWSNGKKLVLATFYFWSSGSPLQRSQNGLLRCLLYKILSQTPDSIPVATPRRWQMASTRMRSAAPWTRKEILDAFEAIVGNTSLETVFCFFIDGLDEYGGSDLGLGESDLDLVLLLQKLSAASNIKICLSSRPRKVYQTHFPNDGSHHIILHHHTARDIERLVDSRFDRVKVLINIEAADLNKLKNFIVERSEGVILWVILVVQELLDGIGSHDLYPELRARLDLLPPTLDGLFRRMINKIHPQHRRFAARLLLLSASEPHLDLEHVHGLWMLEGFSSGSQMITSDNTVSHSSSIDNLREITSSRVLKTCGDLLNVINMKHVDWMHRSVVDFLKLPGTKSELLSSAEWSDDADTHLNFCRVSTMNGRLAYLPTLEPGIPSTLRRMRYDPDLSSQEELIERFMRHAALFERHSGKSCVDLIQELDEAFQVSFQIGLCHFFVPKQPSWPIPEPDEKQPRWPISKTHEFLLIAAIYRLKICIDQALKELPREDAHIVLNDLLKALLVGGYTFERRIRTQRGTFESPLPGAIRDVCARGANVNSIPRARVALALHDNVNAKGHIAHTTIGGNGSAQLQPELAVVKDAGRIPESTIWELYLGMRERDITDSSNATLYDVDLVTMLIEHGADLECNLPRDCTSIQQAIEKRIEADNQASHAELSNMMAGVPAGPGRPQRMSETEKSRIRNALLKRRMAD